MAIGATLTRGAAGLNTTDGGIVGGGDLFVLPILRIARKPACRLAGDRQGRGNGNAGRRVDDNVSDDVTTAPFTDHRVDEFAQHRRALLGAADTLQTCRGSFNNPGGTG